VEKLEIRYLANKESNLLFSLFTDYTDSDQAHRKDDERLLQTVTERLEALNHRYGGKRFFLFHRTAPGVNPSRNSSVGNANAGR